MALVCRLCGHSLKEQETACPQCGASVQEEVPSQARATAPRDRAARIRLAMKVLVPVVVLIGIYTYYSDAFREYHPVIAKQPDVGSMASSARINSAEAAVRVEGPFFILSLKEVRDKRIVRFTDPEQIQSIPVLAYITPSGRLVTAMSISENCRSRDFYLEGEDIHCASCPSHWNASSLEAYACCQKYYPDPIPSTILGDEVRIETRVVREWHARS